MSANNIISRPISKKYKKFTDEEKRNYYAAFKKSGCNIFDFCKTQGISRSALYQWGKKFDYPDHGVDFSPLSIQRKNNQHQPPSPLTDTAQLTISVGHNAMQINVSIPMYRLALFIQELGDATTVIR